jgi:hypothetical protein
MLSQGGIRLKDIIQTLTQYLTAAGKEMPIHAPNVSGV